VTGETLYKLIKISLIVRKYEKGNAENPEQSRQNNQKPKKGGMKVYNDSS